MHRNATASIVALSLGLIALPVRTYAAAASFFGPIVSTTCLCPQSAPDYGCVLQTIQNVTNLGISLAAILATIFAAYTGFIFISSGGSSEARQKGKNLALNLVVGLVLVLSAWLIVDFVMKTLYGGGSQFGPWNALLADNGNHACITPKTSSDSITNGTVANYVANAGAPNATNAAAADGGVIEGKICNASASYYGTNTSAGPGGGSLACAWAVNNVLSRAGISSIGSTAVQGMESALQGGRGTSIVQSAAVCGDVVIEAGDGHVGICQNTGCSQVLSNSSSKATFTWKSAPDFAPSYSNGVGRFYRVIN